jgi:cation:H+ antiporter
MAWNLIALVAGLGLLALAPGRFVAGSAGLADMWGVPRVIVGAVVIGFGTSAPEMLVSGLAAAEGDAAVGTGNIVGSNVANLSLILGVATLIGAMVVPRGLIRFELPFLGAATVLFAVLVQGGLSRFDGTVLAVALAVTLVLIVRRAKQAPSDEAAPAEVLDSGKSKGQMLLDAGLGLVGTVAGAQLLVTGAVGIADELGLSGGFVGMTLVALGTSLPELVTAVAAARAGELTLLLGNLVGSNLFNCLGVGAVVGLVGGGAIDDTKLTTGGVGLMLAVTAAAIVILGTGSRVTRREAAALVAAYVVVVPLLAG